MYKNSLIVGAGSKLVRFLLPELLRISEKITLLTKESDVNYNNLRVSHLKANLAEGCELDDAFDLVVYLAGVTPYGNNKNKSNAYFYDSNVRPLINVLGYCSKIKPKKFIFISSTDVYQLNDKTQITEFTKPKPVNFYGVCKVISENCVNTFGEAFDFDVTILRVGPVYGPGMNRNLSIWKLLKNIWNEEAIVISNPNNILSLVSSKDAAFAIIKSINGSAGLYNIVGSKLTIEEFLKHASRIYNKKTFPFSCVNNAESGINLNFSLSKAEKHIGWKPSYIDEEVVLEMSNEFNG
jgi:nucleoside-diphosphate-sugar epimerase